jgi:uncharacterized protein YggE
MLQRQNISMIIMSMVFLLGGAGARGADSEATVSATGHATALQKPDVLRMTLMISAQGSDIHDALAKLKAQRDDASAKLLATGADNASVKFSDPVEGNEGNMTPQQRMMQQMMARNQRPASTQPAGVTISTNLTVEWPLAPASADDALATAMGLEDKIKAAIPKGGADAAKTPEEQEIAEEMAAQQNGAETSKPDEPQFTFVHRLSDDERAKLMAQAFTDAQARGRRLAAAAGKELGEVTNIATSSGDAGNPANAYIEAMMDASTGSTPPATDDSVATGPQVNNVSYSVTLAVTFKLK